jgi:predicted DsbA family dithiol-disulfide isomerase
MTSLIVDAISDVVCPWCYIGKRRLEKAVAMRPNLTIAIRWRPFQLDASIPPEGVDRKTYMAMKFGSDERARQIFDHIDAVGASEGIAFNFKAITRSPNTLDCHRILRWAIEAGVQDSVKERLMRAYFIEGVDLTDHAVLAHLAAEAGMVEDQVAQWLATDEDRDAVSEEVQQAYSIGVQGVPFFIFGGKLGVSGAQTPDMLVQAIDEALESTDYPIN